jgi:hypothetical protein
MLATSVAVRYALVGVSDLSMADDWRESATLANPENSTRRFPGYPKFDGQVSGLPENST